MPSGGVLAQAQPEVTPSGGLEPVVVTATRHSESIQNVPISMDAITGATLDKLGDKNFFDYASTIPNLSVGLGTGNGGNGSGFGVSSTRSVTIRGVAGNNTTGFYLNDTPLPLDVDPRVLDVDRVEVLRGPQGTLFGAGSMGGTVRIITNQPSLQETSGKIDLQGSDVHFGGGGYSVNGTLNVPLIQDNVALRVSAFSAFDPGIFTRKWGYVTNPPAPLPPNAPIGEDDHVGSDQQTGAMLALAIAPSAVPGLTITPTYIYQRSNSNGYPLADYTPNNLVQVRPLDVPEAVAYNWMYGGITTKYEAEYGRFIASGTYFWRRGYDLEDGTEFTAVVYPGALKYYVAAPLSNWLYTKTFNGEARFESTFHGPVQFVLGVFSELADTRFYEPYPVPGLNAASGGVIGTDLLFTENALNADRQHAEYLNVSYDVTQALQFTAGIRRAYLAHEYTRIAGGYGNGGYSDDVGSHGETDYAPRYTARYQFTPDQMVYASAAKGFRIGGVNSPAPPVCDGDLAAAGLTNGGPFNTDSLWSFEIGSKNSWFGGRVKSRLAAYRIDWKNIQQTTTLACTFDVTTNSGAAVSNGGELEIDAAPTNHLTLNVSVGLEEAKITEATPGSLTVAGQPLNNVPRWTNSDTAQYTIPMGDRSVFMLGQFTYVGSRTSYNNVQTGVEVGAYRLVNLRTGVDQGPWDMAFFVRNLFDDRGNLGDVDPEVGELTGRPRWLIVTPRTIGLELRRTF